MDGQGHLCAQAADVSGACETDTIEEAGLREMALFIVLIYSRTWVEAPSTCDAAVNDWALLDDLPRYTTVNEKISKAALTTFQRHLWYLGSEIVGFSLNDKSERPTILLPRYQRWRFFMAFFFILFISMLSGG